MEEDNKPENTQPEKPKTMGDYITDKKLRAEKKKELFPQYVQEIKDNAAAQEYFSGFSPESVNSFTEQYALQKAEWMTEDNEYASWNSRQQLNWETEAFKRLEEIQQKKLFDLQCQWRAEKIELEDTLITMDFSYWESTIMNCPFLPPITEEELNLYLQYLQSNNYEEEQDLFAPWQDYTGIKEAYETENENRNFPEWYDFYNGRKGTGIYMLLPDIHGPKEKRYRELYDAEFKKIIKASQEAKKAEDPRPIFLNYPHNQIPFIVATFEDKKTQEYYKLFGDNEDEWNEYMDEDDEDEYEEQEYVNIETVFHDLERAPDIIPVKAGTDFREALEQAWKAYSVIKIAEAIPRTYEQYMLHIESGLSFTIEYYESKLSVRDWWRNNILRGRELNGDPRDFNF